MGRLHFSKEDQKDPTVRAMLKVCQAKGVTEGRTNKVWEDFALEERCLAVKNCKLDAQNPPHPPHPNLSKTWYTKMKTEEGYMADIYPWTDI